MAESGTFEDAAAWLWTADDANTEPWQAREDGVAAAVAAQAGCPPASCRSTGSS